MARINLLPWREELRSQRQQEFLMSIGMGVVLTIGAMFIVHIHIEGLKEHQVRRNKMLNTEIAILDNKIKEVKDIEEKKNTLLTKIDVIQQLQESRPQIVHLFDELAKATPEGIYLTQFLQTGTKLTMNGKAQSNARVSAYMRAIDVSPWLHKPTLNVIKGRKKENIQHLSDFTLLASQGADKPEIQEGG